MQRKMQRLLLTNCINCIIVSDTLVQWYTVDKNLLSVLEEKNSAITYRWIEQCEMRDPT